MSKLVKKFRVIAACLSLVLGILGICGDAVAKASVNSNLIILDTIYIGNGDITAPVKVWKTQYEAYGVTLVLKNQDNSTAKTYHVSVLSGVVTFPDGNYATIEYSWDDNYYIISFCISSSTIPRYTRLYIYSGDVEADINGRYFWF